MTSRSVAAQSQQLTVPACLLGAGFWAQDSTYAGSFNAASETGTEVTSLVQSQLVANDGAKIQSGPLGLVLIKQLC